MTRLREDKCTQQYNKLIDLVKQFKRESIRLHLSPTKVNRTNLVLLWLRLYRKHREESLDEQQQSLTDQNTRLHARLLEYGPPARPQPRQQQQQQISEYGPLYVAFDVSEPMKTSGEDRERERLKCVILADLYLCLVSGSPAKLDLSDRLAARNKAEISECLADTCRRASREAATNHHQCQQVQITNRIIAHMKKDKSV